MSASPEFVAAFDRWRLAVAASHFATPCPDEIMDQLVSLEGDACGALLQLQPQSADELLLKLFPLLLQDNEPRRGEPPLKPQMTNDDTVITHAVFDDVIRDLQRLSPSIAAAIGIPHRHSRGHS